MPAAADWSTVRKLTRVDMYSTENDGRVRDERALGAKSACARDGSSDVDSRACGVGGPDWRGARAGRLEFEELVGDVVSLALVLDEKMAAPRRGANHHHRLALGQLGLTGGLFWKER